MLATELFFAVGTKLPTQARPLGFAQVSKEIHEEVIGTPFLRQSNFLRSFRFF
jgi:hypothetical protein